MHGPSAGIICSSIADTLLSAFQKQRPSKQNDYNALETRLPVQSGLRPQPKFLFLLMKRVRKVLRLAKSGHYEELC
jgi:hypothetical protein